MKSIRFRLTLYYSALVIVAIVALAIAAWQTTRIHLNSLINEDLNFRVQALSEEIEFDGSGPHLPEEHTTYAGPHDGYLLIDSKGNLVQQRGISFEEFRPLIQQALNGGPSHGQEGAWLWLARPLQSEGQAPPLSGEHEVRALVMVAHNPVEQRALLGSLQTSLEILVPLLALAMVWGGWLLAGRALAPVYDLAQRASLMTTETLSCQLPVEENELGDLAQAFNHLLQRLDGAFQQERRFSGDASHELRTPLAIIRAQSSHKLMQPRSPEEYVQALVRIDEAADRMGKILESLLFLARCDSGGSDLELQTLDLVPLLQELAVQDPKVRLSHPQDLLVKGDPTLLTQLWSNLLDNARRHGQSTNIWLLAEKAGTTAVIRVRDDGLGIPAEHIPNLFQRFYRVDAARSRATGGSGLGLSICWSIVASHQGQISIDSQIGEGTTVTVVLPK